MSVAGGGMLERREGLRATVTERRPTRSCHEVPRPPLREEGVPLTLGGPPHLPAIAFMEFVSSSCRVGRQDKAPTVVSEAGGGTMRDFRDEATVFGEKPYIDSTS
jgi:hypothetical protein